MNQVEKAVRLNRLGKIFGIVAVGNHGYGRMRPRGISLLHQRRDREHGRCVVQHALLQPMMPPFHAGQEGHPLEPVHLGPRVAEIRNPGDAEFAVQAFANEVQRLRRTGGNDHIHRMFPQVFFQESDRWPHPARARIGYKQVAADPEGEPLLPAFPARGLVLGGGEHFHIGRAPVTHQFPVDTFLERMVNSLIFRVFRGIDDGLPSCGRKIFGKFQPALNARTATGRPVVRDDENPPGHVCLDIEKEMYIYPFLPLIINHIARNKIKRVTNG